MEEESYENYFFISAVLLLTLLAFYLVRIFKQMEDDTRDLHPMDFVPTQKMTQVYNPFNYTLHSSNSSVKGGVNFTLAIQEPCVLLQCWGVNIKNIYNIIYQPWDLFQNMFKDVAVAREKLQELSTCVDQEISIESSENQIYSLKPSKVLNLGDVPRAKYPLVTFLLNPRLQHEDFIRNSQNNIICHVIIHHLSDAVCPASSHIIAQFARTPFGYPCNIRPLYANDEQSYEATPTYSQAEHHSSASSPGGEQHTDQHSASSHSLDPAAEQDTVENSGSDSPPVQISCIICQVYLVDRVILPCRHVCACEVCFPKMDRCPMCRGTIESTFRLGGDMRSELYGPVSGDAHEDDAEQPWWRRWNDKINYFLGFS